MAQDPYVKTQFDQATITVSDGSGTPLQVQVRFDRGDFAIQSMAPNRRNHAAYEARGALVSLRQTTPLYPTLSFSAMFAQFTGGGTPGELLDLVFGNAPYASRVSTSSDFGDVTTFDVELRIPGALGRDHILLMRNVHLVLDITEGDPDTVQANGVVYGEISIDGSVLSDIPLLVAPFEWFDNATELTTSGSSAPLTLTDPGAGWSFQLDLEGGTGDGIIAWDLGELPDIQRVFDEEGRCEAYLEIDRPSASLIGFLALGWYDGTETDWPFVVVGRRPGNGVFNKSYVGRCLGTVAAGALTTTSEVGASTANESIVARATFDFAPENDASRVGHVEVVGPMGTDEDVIDGTGMSATVSRMPLAEETLVRRIASTARAAAGMPRPVVRARVLDPGSPISVKFRVVLRRLRRDEDGLDVT